MTLIMYGMNCFNKSNSHTALQNLGFLPNRLKQTFMKIKQLKKSDLCYRWKISYTNLGKKEHWQYILKLLITDFIDEILWKNDIPFA